MTTSGKLGLDGTGSVQNSVVEVTVITFFIFGVFVWVDVIDAVLYARNLLREQMNIVHFSAGSGIASTWFPCFHDWWGIF